METIIFLKHTNKHRIINHTTSKILRLMNKLHLYSKLVQYFHKKINKSIVEVMRKIYHINNV